MSRVLVVDGDRAARDALVTCLKFVGMEAHGAEDAAEAQVWLKSAAADVLVLADEIAGGLSTDSRASIVVLTRGGAAPTQPAFHVDDTIRRPIAPGRVVERIEWLIEERKFRRDAVLKFGELSLDVASGRAAAGGSQVALGHIETRLLAFFIGLPDKVFSRASLLHRLWPSNVRVAERTVDVHIRRLRLALANLGCAGYIQTVRCSGYRFSAF
jgi:two-component system phosphate regulon response regulator PhoB